MDPFEDCLQENVGFEDNEDSNTFEEFLETEEYIDHGDLFTIDRIFISKDELVYWAKQTAMKANTYLIVNRYQKSRTFNRRPARKIYNVVAKIKKIRMKGRNTVEKVLSLSTEWGYMVFYRNHEESNYGAKSNPILKNISNITSHLAMKKIWLEIKRANEISDDPRSKCGHYLKKSHGLSCAFELKIFISFGELEIGVDIPNVHERDMDSEMLDLTSMLEEISIGPISKVRKVHRLPKGVISPVLPDDPCAPLTTPSPLKITIMKGRRKKNSTKRDKFYWEHVSIVHRKIGMSSGSGSGSGSDSGSGSGPSPRGRGRPTRSGRGRGRGRKSRRSSLSSIVNPDAP
ncbi:hypothetical protein M9H77_08969 [Catharanthus roseus]|uniref:Uncharacterized protein n=1 Tax=Catharanthus roseus TaxID=4058 RepID=A0ACC0BZ92_CATRO|nr:hypothetical protein M9H77_08969 [Catharanthus roseus]